MKQKINISVRSLVEFTLRSGNFELGVGSIPDPVKAIRVHQQIQENRKEEGYQKECSLKHTWSDKSLKVVIQGRADGLLIEENAVTIEEIKTTLDNPGIAVQRKNPLHWGQVKVYAYIYALQNKLNSIQTKLIYCHLESLEQHDEIQTFSFKELEQFFDPILNQYIKWIKTVYQHRQQRNISAKNLRFPFDSFRKGQRQMAVRIYDRIRQGKNILIQAPTGIGKTMAALFSSVKALGEGLTDKIYYLSARNTGHRQVENMLVHLGKAGFDYTYVRLSARDRLCPLQIKECDPTDCRYALGYYDRLIPALEDAFMFHLSEPDKWQEVIKKHLVCPHPFLLELGSWVDCVICDYNYMFDPLVNLYDFTEKKRPEYTVLIDEAHNLIPRSREMFSAGISKQKILSVRRLLKSEAPEVYKKLSGINNWMLNQSKEIGVDGYQVLSDLPADFIRKLSAFVVTVKDFLNSGKRYSWQQQLVDLFFDIIVFLKTSDRFDNHYALVLQKPNPDTTIDIYCINSSKELSAIIKKVGSTVLFSATLSPFKYYLDLFGLEPDTTTINLPSPFPVQNFLTLITPSISTRFQHRQQTALKVIKLLQAVEASNQGNIIFFFPSYAYLKMIQEDYETVCPETHIIVQKPNMTDDERTEFLENFQAGHHYTTIGFAVMGGIFGEGIDLIGTALTAVVILGVGLPGVSKEVDLVKKHYDETMGNGYEYAYVYPGINRVLQAAGRVIRSESDKGMLLLVDDRYSTPKYQTLLPAHWSSEQINSEQDLKNQIESFWTKHG